MQSLNIQPKIKPHIKKYQRSSTYEWKIPMKTTIISYPQIHTILKTFFFFTCFVKSPLISSTQEITLKEKILQMGSLQASIPQPSLSQT